MRSSAFTPPALLATRGTTTSFQRCSDNGQARAGGRARTFRSAATGGARQFCLRR